MKISLVSDLHLEFSPFILDNKEQSDLLVLAGDVCVARDLYRYPPNSLPASRHLAAEFSSRMALAWDYIKFFESVAKSYPQVVYVKGNHESYDGKFDLTTKWLKDALVKFTNIALLDNEAMSFGNMVLFGGTLWSNAGGTQWGAEDCKNTMNDYKYIHVAKRGYARLRVIDTVVDHRDFLRKLDQSTSTDPRPHIVVSHFAPSLKSAEREKLPIAYGTDLDAWIQEHQAIKLWMHGHTHHQYDYTVAQSRVVCWPRGYPGQYDEQYQPKVIEL